MGTINERISEVVKKSGLTKTAFAEKINVSQGFVSQLCSGFSVPSERTLSDICRVFNVDPYWLETGEGEMFRTETVDMELARLVGELMADKPGSFKQRVVAALLRCSDDEWGVFRRVLSEIEKDAEP